MNLQTISPLKSSSVVIIILSISARADFALTKLATSSLVRFNTTSQSGSFTVPKTKGSAKAYDSLKSGSDTNNLVQILLVFSNSNNKSPAVIFSRLESFLVLNIIRLQSSNLKLLHTIFPITSLFGELKLIVKILSLITHLTD